MFYGCTSLTEAPELPATKLAEECYGEMFGYSGLKKAPELPATAGWAAGVPSEGLFECPEGLELKYGAGYIPSGWSTSY